MFRVMVQSSDEEFEQDVQEFQSQILDRSREVEDEDGNVLDPSSLTAEQLREAALDEMGEDWNYLWLYKPDATGRRTAGIDRDSAEIFATREEAQAAIDAYGPTTDILEITEIQVDHALATLVQQLRADGSTIKQDDERFFFHD